MSGKNRILVPQAKKGLEKLKEESAKDLAISNQNPKLKKNFSIGGNMVKKMVKSYENKMK